MLNARFQPSIHAGTTSFTSVKGFAHIFLLFFWQRHHCFVSFTSDGVQTVEVVFILAHPSDPRENQLTEHMEHSLSTKFITIKLGEL